MSTLQRAIDQLTRSQQEGLKAQSASAQELLTTNIAQLSADAGEDRERSTRQLNALQRLLVETSKTLLEKQKTAKALAEQNHKEVLEHEKECRLEKLSNEVKLRMQALKSDLTCEFVHRFGTTQKEREQREQAKQRSNQKEQREQEKEQENQRSNQQQGGGNGNQQQGYANSNNNNRQQGYGHQQQGYSNGNQQGYSSDQQQGGGGNRQQGYGNRQQGYGNSNNNRQQGYRNQQQEN